MLGLLGLCCVSVIRFVVMLSALLLVDFLCCIVSKEIRKPDAVNLPILVSD